MNPLYPIFLKLSGEPILVIGGGPVALRRVESLVEAAARVLVVSPRLVRGLEKLALEKKIEWRERPFSWSDLEGIRMVFLAAGDPELARALREEATRRGILLNAAGDERLSDFHVPAVASQGEVKVAVSTSGVSPKGASRIRDKILAWLEEHSAFIASALALGRPPPGWLVGGSPGSLVGASGPPQGRVSPGEFDAGKVWLVGAGPGDPHLLTLRAAALLGAADIVYYDRLVSEEVLSVIPPLTEKVYVGKEVGSEARADIPSLMIQSARQGKRVVRLKGGDPLIFGRGGEEMLALAQAGIEFEVVSGVSALSSVPAAAGIPVTCRGIASEIIVRSGHCLTQGPLEDAGDEPVTGATTGSPITYIYFMAAGRLAGIVEDLRREGLPPSTPVAMIQKGTLPDQQVLAGNLENIVELAEVQGVETPALFVAGEVVRFFYIQELLPALEETVRQGE